MAALVEVHTTDELEGGVETGARLIGINNRDLHTFQVDLNTTCALASCIPPERVVVSESGITTAADMKKLAATRVDAVLVGTVLMSSPDPGAALSSLLRETV
jgi:indole-3-glycerol phosphate synthase